MIFDEKRYVRGSTSWLYCVCIQGCCYFSINKWHIYMQINPSRFVKCQTLLSLSLVWQSVFSDSEAWVYICDPVANLGEITFQNDTWPDLHLQIIQEEFTCDCGDTKDRFSKPVSLWPYLELSNSLNTAHHSFLSLLPQRWRQCVCGKLQEVIQPQNYQTLESKSSYVLLLSLQYSFYQRSLWEVL